MQEIICSITQPHYLPWKGYFNLIKKADIFIFLDDVKYIKREWKNRNKIRKTFSSNEYKWISIPIDKENQNNNLNNCKIFDDIPWREEHVNQIYQTYKKTEYFEKYFHAISEIILDKNINILSELNIKLIEYFCKLLEITTKRMKSSSLNSIGVKELKLIDICKKVNAKTYLANDKSSDYIANENFSKERINLVYQNYIPHSYNQYYNKEKLDEIQYLSIVDLIFNQGHFSKEFI